MISSHNAVVKLLFFFSIRSLTIYKALVVYVYKTTVIKKCKYLSIELIESRRGRGRGQGWEVLSYINFVNFFVFASFTCFHHMAIKVYFPVTLLFIFRYNLNHCEKVATFLPPHKLYSILYGWSKSKNTVPFMSLLAI